MKNKLLIFSLLIGLFSCTTSKENKEKTLKINDVIGYYETTIGAASTPGRLMSLQIKENQQAYFSVDYLNSTPEFIDTLSWTKKNDKIELNCINNSCDEKIMRFKLKENKLIYIGDYYGENGLILIKKEQPKPINKKLFACIKKENDTTFISYGAKAIRWRLFNKPIEKLEIEEGEFYMIWILRKPMKNSKFTYEFIDFIKEEE